MELLRKEYKEGETVWLDKDLSNRSQVIVVRQTSGKLFTTVKTLDSNASRSTEWDVMTNRLSSIEKK